MLSGNVHSQVLSFLLGGLSPSLIGQTYVVPAASLGMHKLHLRQCFSIILLMPYLIAGLSVTNSSGKGTRTRPEPRWAGRAALSV